MKDTDLNFNQLCGKILREARVSKNISVEDVAFYLLPQKEDKSIEVNQKLEEKGINNLQESVENSYIRKKIFENAEMEKTYKENIKKINYWENGNGFPDLNEIYKLAEIIDIDPNEIYKYRELGRKNLKGENKMSNWKYYRNRFIDTNMEALRDLFPFLVMAAIIWFLFVGADFIPTVIKFFHEVFAGNHY